MSKEATFATKIIIAICLVVTLLYPSNNALGFAKENIKEGECTSELEALEPFKINGVAKEDFQKILCADTEIYGEELYSDITKKSDPPKAQKQHVIIFLQLENWKNFSSLTPEEIDKILSEYFTLYPQTWTWRVKSVSFEPKNQKPSCIKNPESNEWVGGSAEYEPSSNLWKIHIYPIQLSMSLTLNPTVLCETFSHELAHTSDWKSVDMTPEQKLEFFQKTVQRLNSPDHYADKDGYLKKISLDTPEKTAYRKVKEYWAIISNAYLENKKGLPAQDKQLVESVLKQTDPQFTDVAKNAKSRRSLLDKIFM